MVSRGLGAWLSGKGRICVRAAKERKIYRCAGVGRQWLKDGCLNCGGAEEQGCSYVRFQGEPTRW